MSLNKFYIKKKEGINFAKISGDNNSIHIDEIYGYNSIYGENIAHGVLVILKFLKKIKIKKNFSYIKVFFNEGAKYNHKISLKKIKKGKKKLSYELVLLNNTIVRIELGFFPNDFKIRNLEKISLERKFHTPNIKKKNFFSNYIPSELNIALYKLTEYVGTIFPGENSLISEINISNLNFNLSDKVIINSDSTLLKKGFPIIENRLKYKNYNIQFRTYVRPKLKIKLQKPPKKIINEINSIKENVLIIGASSGIGNDLLKLFLNNKKIKIIATYYKNKILIKNKNLIIKKLNIEKSVSLVYNIIKRYSPIIIYYFATPKILFKSIKDKNFIKLYNKYFIDIPIKLIKFSNNYECKFFYPSTTYNNSLSEYSLIKLKAERKIKKLKNNKVRINIAKIPGINTRQTLSMISKNLPNFRDLIFQNEEIFKKIFFKN